MIWKNALLHNVSELVPVGTLGGYSIRRIPTEYEKYLSASGQKMNSRGCGVEIAFVLKGDKAKIKLSVGEESSAACARIPVFYGSIGAGYTDCLKTVFSTPTEIVIPKPQNLPLLEKISDESRLAFSPRVVRLLLQNLDFRIYDIEGDIEPPTIDMLPKKKYLAYGSSITHGSLALMQCNTWTARVAENTKAQLFNLGFAGSACLEKEMADYIANCTEFDFATLEMGINILNIDVEDFRSRVRYFVSTIAKAHPNSKLFCIDVFRCQDDLCGGTRAKAFRRVVAEVLCELGLSNTIHVDGMEILTSYAGLSGDLVHPNIRGVEEMAQKLTKVILEECKL